MLNFLKKMLGKPAAAQPGSAAAIIKAPAPQAVPTPQAVPELLQGMAQVEVAHLSLAAILRKLPQELSGMVAQMPDDEATVALPVNTIHKQLPTGSVKMSLASLYRQAPAGTFTAKGAQDRRMVEVPLSEILRHVKPETLRRSDQRRVEVPEDAVALFGNKENPYAIEPAVPEESEFAGYRPRIEPPAPAAASGRTLRPSDDMRTHTSDSANGSHESSAPAMDLGLAVNHAAPSVSPQRVVPPPADFGAPPPASDPTPSPASKEPPLTIELAALAVNWPEPLRTDALALADVKVALPAGAVTAGLAKGKVAFTWGQLRSWFEPPTDASAAHDATELILPLKVVAPAFLRRSKPAAARKTFEMDESIPALFSGTSAPPPPAEVSDAPAVPAAAEEEKAPAAEIPPIPPPVFPDAPVDRAPDGVPVEDVALPPSPTLLSVPSVDEESVAAKAPAAEEPAEAPATSDSIPGPTLSLVQDKPEESPAAENPAPEVESQDAAPEKSASADPAVRIASTPPPGFLTPGAAAPVRTLGEVLGQPEKTHWSPPDLVKATVEFEGVAGAIIALQEGFVVAADLPENLKADTMAAFLPQIFARLNNYAAEMGLGEVGDLLTTTNGAQLQVHRFGEVYFAILGRTGEILPWEKIGPVVAELANQHRK